jgi:hypothetical protein
MRPATLWIGLLLVAAASPVPAGLKRDVLELEEALLTTFKSSPQTSMMEILGAPTDEIERDGKTFLTWDSTKQSGLLISGVGKIQSQTCKATFEYDDDELIAVTLLATHRSDRKMCKKLAEAMLAKAGGQP